MPTYTSQPDATAGIDTFVNEALPDTAAPAAVSGNMNYSAAQRRPMLLKFDLSSIAAGSTINSATLSLWNAATNTANRTLSAYAILAANSGWVEGATWNYANPSTVRWAGDTSSDGGTDAGCSVAGTDYNATAMGSVIYIANAAIDTQLDIVLSTSQVAALVSANYGIMVKREDAVNVSLSIRTSDYVTDATKRPKLVIVYTTGSPVTATAAITLDACTLVATGTLAIAATASVTLGAATLAATGTLALSGQLTSTLGAVQLSSTGALGALPITGTLSITLGDVTLVSLGVLVIIGAATMTLGSLTMIASERAPVIELAYGFVYGAASDGVVVGAMAQAVVYGASDSGEVRGV